MLGTQVLSKDRQQMEAQELFRPNWKQHNKLYVHCPLLSLQQKVSWTKLSA